MARVIRYEITPKIQEIKNKVDIERARIHKVPGVVATAITHSSVTGIDIDKPDNQVVVYVKDKSALKDIPAYINGVKVVYRISSGFKPVVDINRYRPLRPGCEITSTSGLVSTGCYVGTLGGFPQLPDGTRIILSNNHVLANDTPNGRLGKVGDIIYQPGCQTEGIGTLSNWTPISSTGVNLIDAAYALINPNVQINEYALCNYGISQTVAPVHGMNIIKTGRTSGCTTGTIDAIDAMSDIDYSPDPNVTATAHFENQILTSPGYAAGGDSGSVVVTNDANHNSVGLLFAADNSGVALVNPMTYVEQILGIKFQYTSLPALTGCNACTLNQFCISNTCIDKKTIMYGAIGTAAILLLSIAS